MAIKMLAAPSAYLVILLLFFGRFFLPGHGLEGGDWTLIGYPFHQFGGEVFLSEGRLPFWNDLILGGIPHLSSLNVTALYPTELLSLPFGLPSPLFYALDLVFHLLVAGSMFAIWMRYRGLSAVAAFVGGLVWMLGAHALTLAGAGHPHTVRCLAWLPAVFYMLERGGRGDGIRWYAGAGAGLGACILTIAIQFVAYAAPLCVLMAFFTGKIPVGRRVAGVGVFLGALSGIGAVVLVPGMEYYLYSSRALSGGGMAGQWALSPWELPAMVIPEIFGGMRDYFGPHQFRDSSDYAGLIPLVLAVMGAASAWRANLRWTVTGLVAVALAFGPATPLGQAMASLPVYGGFRNPLMWMHFFILALCIFAATGWSVIETGPGRRKAKLAGIALLALSAPLFLLALKPGNAAAFISHRAFVQTHVAEGSINEGEIVGKVSLAGWKAASVSAVSGVVMLVAGAPFHPLIVASVPCLAIIADLLMASSGYIHAGPSSLGSGTDPVSKWLAGRKGDSTGPFRAATDEHFSSANARMPAGIQWVSGYHSVGMGRYAALYEEARTSPSMDLLSLMNVRFVVSSSGPQAGWKPEKVVDSGGGKRTLIYANAGVLPRAFFPAESIVCPDFESVMRVIRAPGWNPARMPLDSPLPEGWRPGKMSPKAAIVSASYRREEIVARVSMGGAGMMVFSENWYPAWKGFVDGKRAGIIRAYGVFRALALPAGMHEVRMIYDSWLFKIGLWLTLLTASVFIALVLAPRKTGAV